LLRKPKQTTPAAPAIVAASLAERAALSLAAAAEVQPDNPELVVEERAIWQPDSWLLRSIWQALADRGAGSVALTVAQLTEPRAPQSRYQVLHRLAQQTAAYPEVAGAVRDELHSLHTALFGAWPAGQELQQVERLLLAAAAAATIGEPSLAFACLERADQWERVWDRVLLKPDWRTLLAETVARVGLHPLTSQLITLAVRRYEDSGAQFLHQIVGQIAPRVTRDALPRRVARLLQRCVDSFQYATLASLTSRRLAMAVFGRAGQVDDVLEQLTTIGNVQEARRDSGISSNRDDPHFLRAVKRPAANLDVDFQVHALQEAVRLMPVRAVPREARKALADRLAALAIRSDGWTAAGAAASLIELGALKYAVGVVDHIAPTDPTRSEGIISLVAALLDFGDAKLADEQVAKALTWVKSLDKRNPERATVWGLAEVYLNRDQPGPALRLLDQRIVAPTLRDRVREVFGSRVDDDQLRDNRLRFRALLRQGSEWTKELQALYDQLCVWTPKLLDGESLIMFYVDGLLRPLVAAGRTDLIWPLLPQVRAALNASSGDKHTTQVQRVASVLAGVLTAALTGDDTMARASLTNFVADLWDADIQKGLWQTIHGIEGALPLLMALEGPHALVKIAQTVAAEGAAWTQTENAA
jgi:hypothetical protein